MSWLRIDDQFCDHPKFYEAIDRGGEAVITLWLRAGCYSRRFNTNGFISSAWLRQVAPGRAGKQKVAALVQSGLWSEIDGGIKIHDFEQYNPADEDKAPSAAESPDDRKRREARERASAYRARVQQSRSGNPSRDEQRDGVTQSRDESCDGVTQECDGVRDGVTEKRDGVTSPPLASPPLNSPSPSQIPRDARDGKCDESSDASRDGVTQSRDESCDAYTVTASQDVTSQHVTRAPTRLQSMLAASYAEGIREASGQPFAEPIAAHDLKQLEAMCRAHKRGADPIEWQHWLKESAKEYRLAKASEAQYQSGFSPTAWAKWLNAGKPTKLTSQAGTKQRSDGTDWTQTAKSKAARAELDRRAQEQQAAGITSLLHGLVEP